MSLLLAGLVLAGTGGALVLNRLLARRRDPTAPEVHGKTKTEDGDDEDEDEAQGRAEADVAAPARGRSKEEDLQGFVCQLGDVIMRLTGEEAWLAGGLVLSEEVPVAVLFVAPDAGQDCVVYARARPQSSSILWLEPLDPKAVLVLGEPPSSVEHGGIRFDRARKLPLRPRRIGVGAPDVGDSVIVAEYSSAGAERLIVLKATNGLVCAYRGLELESGSFDVIASGASTLES